MAQRSNPGSGQISRIGLWGPRSAGKTTYLALLYHGRDQSGWKMTAVDDPSDEFRLAAHEQLFDKAKFPSPTNLSEVHTYGFDITRPNLVGKGKTFRLIVADASGEWFEDPSGMANRFPERQDNPYLQLASCQGLILLLDPTAVMGQRNKYYRIISRALGMLKRHAGHGRIEDAPLSSYLAICFTQMDKHANLRKYVGRDAEKSLQFAKEVLGEETLKDLNDSCEPSKLEFFCITAIGWRQKVNQGEDPINVTTGSGQEATILDPGQIRPIGVFEPIEWLIGRFSPGIFG